MKKTLTIFFAVFLIVSLSVGSVNAMSGDFSTMAQNYRTANAKIGMDNGVVNLSGKMIGIEGTTTKVSVHLYLQQYKNGKWTDYDDWLESKNGTSLTVSKTVTVPTGYKYRAKASCYAYAGNNCEHVVKYSGEVQ